MQTCNYNQAIVSAPCNYKIIFCAYNNGSINQITTHPKNPLAINNKMNQCMHRTQLPGIIEYVGNTVYT